MGGGDLWLFKDYTVWHENHTNRALLQSSLNSIIVRSGALPFGGVMMLLLLTIMTIITFYWVPGRPRCITPRSCKA